MAIHVPACKLTPGPLDDLRMYKYAAYHAT